MLRAILIILACAALAACGGGGNMQSVPTDATNTITPAASEPKAPALQIVKIAMYGDSTTYGTTRACPTCTPYQSLHNEPVSLQWALQQDFGADVIVENHGVGGSTCPDWLWGQNAVPRTWANEMAQSDAQIITMNCAINDAFRPEELDVDIQYVYGQFTQVARAYGKTFVIMMPNPIDDPHNTRLGEIVGDEYYVASVQNVMFVDHWNAIQSSVSNWPTYLVDHIHPHDALYEYKAQLSYGMLRPPVAAILGR